MGSSTPVWAMATCVVVVEIHVLPRRERLDA